MRIVKDTETGEPVLAFDQRGVGCLEQLVTARHQMYANVYWHRAVRSATVMFKHLFYIFQRIFPERELLEKLFFKAGSDDRLLLLLEEHLERHRRKIRSQDPNVEAAIHLARVVSGRNRRLYKAVVQCDHGTKTTRCYGEHSYRAQRGKAKKIFDILAAEGMWGPEAKRMGAHNVLIDCREDWWPPFETIQILNAQGKSESLEKQATTVKQLGESFRKQACKLRVFINVDVLKPEFAAKNRRFEVETVIRTNLEQK
jgi:HD superfamily phosphohydrolase